VNLCTYVDKGLHCILRLCVSCVRSPSISLPLHVDTSVFVLFVFLQIVLVASSDTERTCADAVIALYRKYQITVHNDNPARLTLASMQRFLVKSPLKVIINEYSSLPQKCIRSCA